MDAPNTQCPEPASFPPGRLKVLLVDDQAIVGEAVRRMLAGEPDIEFQFCSDPFDAVATASRFQPTVILQDLVMPNLNGLALVRRFRANPSTQHTPIIVLTTKEDPMFQQDAKAAGADDYLIKLPEKAELISRIREYAATGE